MQRIERKPDIQTEMLGRNSPGPVRGTEEGAVNASKLERLLSRLSACEDAQTWAKGKSLGEAWDSCKRGDWMLWLCGRMAGKAGWPTKKQVVLAACACARTALRFVPAREQRPLQAIETAEKWTRGEAKIGQVRTAAYAAYAAYAAAAYTFAAYAAAYAATAAASYAAVFAAADYATDAASYAASYAAAAASYAAADAADAASASAADARRQILKECADIVRSMLKIPAQEVVDATN